MVDDDRELCRMVVRYLSQDGFDASAVHDGPAAIRAVRASRCDVMILDVMMPGMSGHDVLRQVGAMPGDPGSIPVLMLTARGDEVDRVIGLETGADDYLAKPCSLRELAARLRAILRRTAPAANGVLPTLTVGDITLDAGARCVTRCGEPLCLTSAELAILWLLMEAAGRLVRKERLTEQALGRGYTPFDRSVDVHIGNLRRKLAAGDGSYDSYIKTVRGRGYLLVAAGTRPVA